MNFKITTLVENTVSIGGSRKLIGEHGLAFLIETRDRNILFDTGQYLALENNARVLGIDLKNVDSVVLSHGHYDHTGGLKHLLDCNSNFSLFAHPAVFSRKLKKSKGKYRKIGIPLNQNDLVKQNVKLILDAKPLEILPGLMTTGEILLLTDFESVTSGFVVEKDGHKIPDMLADDMALILDTGSGLVVMLGCSHRGVINTLRQVKKITGRDKIYAIMGGLHLVKATEKRLKQIMQHMREFQPEKIVVGHCTGSHAIHALYNQFKDKVILNTVGAIYTF
jgi:7,8-dihydropterin-6-yl-methyl-4-(beta-D-ribofuranosyl)aminobenzene 5'-phosphate synthase